MEHKAPLEYLEQSFKALSDKNRLQILSTMADGEICACDILDELKITQPTLSHHMKILHDCKLVDARRDGKWVHYSLNDQNEVLVRIKDLLT